MQMDLGSAHVKYESLVNNARVMKTACSESCYNYRFCIILVGDIDIVSI